MWRLAPLVVALAASFVSMAEAQGTVAVERITGPQGGSLRAGLVRSLKNAGYRVVGQTQIRRAARRSRVRRRSYRPRDYAKIARRLGAVGFVSGRVRRRGRTWALVVSVRGADGARAGSARWSGRTLGSLRSIRRNGARRLRRYLQAAPAEAAPVAAAAAAEPEPTPTPAPTPPATEPTPPPQPPPVVASGTPWYSSDEPPPEPEPTPEWSGAPRGSASEDWTRAPEPDRYDEDRDDRYDEDRDDRYDEDRDDRYDEDRDDRYDEDRDDRYDEDRDDRYDEDRDDRYDEDRDDRYDEDRDDRYDEDRAPDPGAYDKFHIGVQVGFLRRSMATLVHVDGSFRPPFNANAGIQPEIRQYVSGGLGHLEGGIVADIFPGALLDEPVVPWLGIVASFRNSLLLNSQGDECTAGREPMGGRQCQASGARVPVGTSQREIYAGLRADYRFSEDHRRGPYLTVDVGVDFFAFLFDPNDLLKIDRTQILPPMEYTSLHLGAGMRYGLTETFFIGIRGGYRLGLRMGENARAIWGTATGPAQGFLVGADVIHEMSYIWDNLFVALHFDFFRFTTKFEGLPRCITPPAGMGGGCDREVLWESWPTDDGSTVREGGGILEPVVDQYMRLALTLGIVFR